jgi:diguanylate cyclase (GGDEF)-like protein
VGESLSNRQLARGAAAFFLMAGAIGYIRSQLSFSSELEPQLLRQTALLAMVLASAFWIAPWDRWPRGALLSVALGAFVLRSTANLAGGTGPYIYVVHYVVLFMWIGLALPGWARAVCVPFFLASYVSPALAHDGGGAVLASVGVVAPACILVGELSAWISTQTRRAEASSRERAEKMATLVDATLALAASHELEELGRLTAAGAARLLGARSSLVLVGQRGAGLRVAGQLDWKGDGIELPRTVLDRLEAALSSHARGGACGLSDQESCTRLAEELSVPGLAIVPLQGSADPLGVVLIAFETPRPSLDEFTRYVLQTFATQAGLGYERLRAAAVLRDESLHDPLTGVGNRRKVTAALALLKEGDALVLVDLDHFKAVNDSYGHAAGDRVLCTLADYLRSCVRPPDEVFRLGGEEFLLLLSGGGRGGLPAVERIHAGWRGQHRVTSWSAGIAIHRAGESGEETLLRADAALYAAKRGGRNRVVSWSEDLGHAAQLLVPPADT